MGLLRTPVRELLYRLSAFHQKSIVNPFRDSSMVEQLPVKELVVGSSPTRGAR